MPAASAVHGSARLLGLGPVRRSYLNVRQEFCRHFLQIPRSRRRSWYWLYPPHCRADQGLSHLRPCTRQTQQKGDEPIDSFAGSVALFCAASAPGRNDICLSDRKSARAAGEFGINWIYQLPEYAHRASSCAAHKLYGTNKPVWRRRAVFA